MQVVPVASSNPWQLPTDETTHVSTDSFLVVVLVFLLLMG